MLGFLASILTGPLVGRIVDLVKAYQERKLSEAEIEGEVRKAVIAATAEVEAEWARASAQMYSSFIAAAARSRLLAAGWLAVLVSQLLVLLWHQMGIPLYVHITGTAFPSSGATVDWAYALVALCLGGGAVMLKGAGRGA